MSAGRRTGNRPWKHIYGIDRKYTARVDRLAARTSRAGQHPRSPLASSLASSGRLRVPSEPLGDSPPTVGGRSKPVGTG